MIIVDSVNVLIGVINFFYQRVSLIALKGILPFSTEAKHYSTFINVNKNP